MVQTIKASGHGQVSYNWLFEFDAGRMFLPSEPQKRPSLRLVQ